VSDPNFQQHDFEPGITSNGVFWTIAVPAGSIDVDPGSGAARLQMADVDVLDYHDLFNALIGGGPAPAAASVSFDVRWAGGGDRERVRDADSGFVGEFVSGPATISFTATVGGHVFTSDSAGQSNPAPPAVGHERNGIFFH
jgi:hypothetical protein